MLEFERIGRSWDCSLSEEGLVTLGDGINWHSSDWESTSEWIDESIKGLATETMTLLQRVALGELRAYIYEPKDVREIRFASQYGLLFDYIDAPRAIQAETERYKLLAQDPISPEQAVELAQRIADETSITDYDAAQIALFS